MKLPDDLPADARDLLTRTSTPDWSQPMLATLTHDYFSRNDWIYERKLDGERVLAVRTGDAVHLMSRNRKDISGAYPELVEAIAGAVKADCILDGEVVAFEGDTTSFSRLQQRMQIRDADIARKSPVKVCYYLFDIVHAAGYNCDKLPLDERKKLLKDMVAFDDPLRYTIYRRGDGEAFLKEACKRGWEGLIAKRSDAPYTHGRSRDWLKFKCSAGQELVIGGFTKPHGNRSNFGALLVGYYDDGKLRYAGKVGTGFDRETLDRVGSLLRARKQESCPFDDEVREKQVTWVKPELVGEFGFTEWTGSGKLRHPRFHGLRRDKKARDVVREEKDR